MTQSGLRSEDGGGLRRSVLRHDGAVGFHDIDPRAAAGQFDRNDVAGDGGAREQYALPGQVVRLEGGEQALRDVLLAHEIDFEVQRLDGGARGRSDGADAGAKRGDRRAERSRRSMKKRTPLALVKISQS